MNGCPKDSPGRGSTNQKLETTSLENKGSGLVGSALDCPEIRGQYICQRAPFQQAVAKPSLT